MNTNDPTHGIWLKSTRRHQDWILELSNYVISMFQHAKLENEVCLWNVKLARALPENESKSFKDIYEIPFSMDNIAHASDLWKQNDILSIGPFELRSGTLNTFRTPHSWPEITLVLPQPIHTNIKYMENNIKYLLKTCYAWNLNYIMENNYWNFIQYIWPLKHEQQSRRNGLLTGEIDCRDMILGISQIFSVSYNMIAKCGPKNWETKLTKWRSHRIEYGDGQSGAVLFICTDNATNPSDAAVAEILQHLTTIMPI